ncbi:protein scabrous [Phthorimaea operculella]|nr:protein scabrous [Phthorimaea operculella]
MSCFSCFTFFFLLTLSLNFVDCGQDTKVKEQIQNLNEQIEQLKTLHLTDLTRMRIEFEEFKQQLGFRPSVGDVARPSMEDLRAEVGELRDALNHSTHHQEMQAARNELKQALVENSELEEMVRAQQERADRMQEQLDQLQYQLMQLQGQLASLDKGHGKKQDALPEAFNEVEEDAWQRHAHRLRHQKTIATHVNKILHEQELLTHRLNGLQTQIFDVHTRLDHYVEPNWNLVSTKLEMLELEQKVQREELHNQTLMLSDCEKLHASMLELREELETIENKADTTMPEIRKEISKLDIDYAQLNAQSSYLKEDQENLRQSVKAIAVSISNAIDRADADRLTLHHLNQSVADLDSRAKQHYYRLNDHILKSEANRNLTEMEISLPELMGEVKELQPVESEYQDLVKQLPRDCSRVSGAPGVYLIRPGHSPVEAWCANGSTLLQRRFNGTVDFNRKFAEYVHEFGDPAAEFWLGLDAMHRLTADNCSSMRIDMTDIYGGGWYAQYEHFSVGDSGSGYVLEVSGFKGNASDAFEYQNHMEFSAIDRDRDISNTHCAGNYEGGWWFSHCQHVNINGKYTLGLTWFDSARNEWIAVASSEMRLYRRPRCH